MVPGTVLLRSLVVRLPKKLIGRDAARQVVDPRSLRRSAWHVVCVVRTLLLLRVHRHVRSGVRRRLLLALLGLRVLLLGLRVLLLTAGLLRLTVAPQWVRFFPRLS